MHEWSLVQALLSEVETHRHPHAEAVVRRLHLRIGALAGVDRGLFQTAFETFRQGTPCEEAELAIRDQPAAWACPCCKAAIPPGTPLRCTTCDVPARLAAGEDIVLDRIELEIPDV